MGSNTLESLADVQIRLRELRFKTKNSDDRERVRLPFGSGIRVDQFKFEKTGGSADEIRARLRKGGNADHFTILSPGYHARDFITHPKTGKRIPVKLWTVYSDRDRLSARQVIQRVHYLSDNGRGMFLACAFGDPQQQADIRKIAKRQHKNAEDLSWVLPCGGVIGCAVLDTLWHGNPIAGRTLIAEALGFKKGDWKNLPRNEIVTKFRLAWASRFAVDSPYQGLGIGAVLALYLKKVARFYHAPSADFIEVITTTPRGEAATGENDFLLKAGYKKLESKMKSGSLMVMDESGYRIPKPAVKNYYYADLRNEKP
jgi:hypothetical protein